MGSAGRTAYLIADRTSLTGKSENVSINVKNRSHTITADVEIPKDGVNGVIFAQARRVSGWSFYLTDGKPMTAPSEPGRLQH